MVEVMSVRRAVRQKAKPDTHIANRWAGNADGKSDAENHVGNG